MEPLLHAQGLSKSFKGRKVVQKVSLNVYPGEIVGLLGPNGAGKTTTFRMCMGMVPPDEGKIVFRNREITRWPIYKRARLGMGYLAQEPSVFRKLSVIDNLLAVLELGKLSADEQKVRAESLLQEFGLDPVRQSLGEVLSGGERRRLEIARALASNPSLILLDEPFSGIDPVAVEEIQGILESLKNQGISILLTDHNVRETLFITDRTYILAGGEILAEGKAEDLAADQKVREIYLGKRFELA
jgi:lipopolysaccharide export system ATP-binding protein